MPSFGRHAIHNGRELLAQAPIGKLLVIDLDLTANEGSYPLLQNPQTWFPPIEEMVAMPPCDARVFVTNRNDDSLSIVDLPRGWTLYGLGCPGTGGLVPLLSGRGCPSPGNTVTVALMDGLGGSTAFLAFGDSTADVSVGPGCSLLVDPVQQVVAMSLDGAGAGALSFGVPPGAPVGAIHTVQAFVVDSAGAAGFSASNALRAVVE